MSRTLFAMISPMRPPEEFGPPEDLGPPEKLALREARRLVAQMLLSPDDLRPAAPPRMATWKAAVAAAWVVGVTAFYLARMLGWI